MGGPGFAQQFWSQVLPFAGREQPPTAAAGALAELALGAAAGAGMLPGLRLDEPAYAAPEALRGDPVDGRARVFTLAVLLFERLTGEHPFGPDLKTRTERIRGGQLAPRSELVGRLPGGLAPLLLSALRPDPTRRPQSLAAFGQALRSFAAGGHAAPMRALSRDDERTEIIDHAAERAAELHARTLAGERRLGRGRRRLLGVALALVAAALAVFAVALLLTRR